MTTTLRCLPLLLALFAFPPTVFAHRLDEYLQATLVVIEPGGILLQINLTPGTDVAEKVIALIDRDNNGVISTNEAAAYGELLKRDLTVRLDQRNVELTFVASNFPVPAELRTGVGIIQAEFSVPLSNIAAGPHKLALENRHQPAISVYLLNAAKPASALIQITGQKRNENQNTGEIAFEIHSSPGSSKTIVIVALLAALTVGLFWGRRAGKRA